MAIEKIAEGNVLTIALSGRLDTTTAPKLETELKQNISGVNELVLDFSRLEYLSSAGLCVLLSAQKVMNRQGGMVVRNANEIIILIHPFGANGVWLAFLLSEILTLLTVILCLSLKNRKFRINLDSIMMLDENFGGDPNDRLELSIGNSMDEVMMISKGIYKFGANRNLSRETLNILSLCIEYRRNMGLNNLIIHLRKGE